MQCGPSSPQLQEPTPGSAACEQVIYPLCRCIYYKGSQSLRWAVAPGHLSVRSKFVDIRDEGRGQVCESLICFRSFHFHLLRMVPQPKEARSSKAEAKVKALRAKKALENIHSFKKVCTFPTCGRPETQPSGRKGSPGTPARAPHSRPRLNFISL